MAPLKKREGVGRERDVKKKKGADILIRWGRWGKAKGENGGEKKVP